MNLQLTMINKQHLVRTREEELVWSGFDVRSATALATPLHWSRFSVLSAKLSRRPVINSRTYHLKRNNLLTCLLLQKLQYTVFNLQWGFFFGGGGYKMDNDPFYLSQFFFLIITGVVALSKHLMIYNILKNYKYYTNDFFIAVCIKCVVLYILV